MFQSTVLIHYFWLLLLLATNFKESSSKFTHTLSRILIILLLHFLSDFVLVCLVELWGYSVGKVTSYAKHGLSFCLVVSINEASLHFRCTVKLP